MSLHLVKIILHCITILIFTEYVAETIKQSKLADVKGVEICEPQPPSEDFAFMLKHCQVLLYILEQNLEG